MLKRGNGCQMWVHKCPACKKWIGMKVRDDEYLSSDILAMADKPLASWSPGKREAACVTKKLREDLGLGSRLEFRPRSEMRTDCNIDLNNGIVQVADDISPENVKRTCLWIRRRMLEMAAELLCVDRDEYPGT